MISKLEQQGWKFEFPTYSYPKTETSETVIFFKSPRMERFATCFDESKLEEREIEAMAVQVLSNIGQKYNDILSEKLLDFYRSDRETNEIPVYNLVEVS